MQVAGEALLPLRCFDRLKRAVSGGENVSGTSFVVASPHLELGARMAVPSLQVVNLVNNIRLLHISYITLQVVFNYTLATYILYILNRIVELKLTLANSTQVAKLSSQTVVGKLASIAQIE